MLLSIIILSCSSSKNSDCNYITDYYPNTSKGELEYLSGNYKEAFKYYKRAFENCEPLNFSQNYDIQNFAIICTRLGKNDLALDYIEKSIEKGITIKTFQKNPVFKKIFDSERGENLKKNYSDKRAKYLSNLNLELRSKIQKMRELDIKFNSTKYEDSIYNLNDSLLVQIFEKYGYPNEQLIGNFGIDQQPVSPEIILIHSRDSIRINYFIPQIMKFVKNGNCPPLILGALHDNLDLYNGNKLSYGVYPNKRISDTAVINQNRKTIGLPSLSLTKKIDSLKNENYDN